MLKNILISIYNFFIKTISFLIFPHQNRRNFRKHLKIKKKSILTGNNRIICVQNGIEKIVNQDYFKGLDIQINGNNNTVKIYEPNCFQDCKIIINGTNNFLEIKETKYAFQKTIFNISFGMKNRKILIGENCSIGEALLINNFDGSILKIGQDCMFSGGIHIRTDDGHVICQKGTKNIINKGGDVIIGNHVWLCRNVFINKNVSIANNCIIASGAVVVKGFEETNVILGGVPAHILKRDVEWYRTGYTDFIEKNWDK